MSKKNQLITIVLTLTIIGVLISLGSAYFIRERISESLIEEEARADLVLTEQIARLLEKEVKSIEDKVNLLAQFPEVRDGDTESCNKKLAEVAPYLSAQIDNITRFNTNLTLDCAINKSAIGYVLTPESPITAVIRDPNHTPYLSYSGYSPTSNQEVLYLNLPVYSSTGVYKGIIGGVIYLNYIADKYLKDVSVGEGAYINLLDDNRGILFHRDPTLIGKNVDSPEISTRNNDDPKIRNVNDRIFGDTAKGLSGSVRYVSNGVDKIAVYAPAKVFENRIWTVILVTPIKAILDKVDKGGESGGISFFIYLSSAIILVLLLFSALILFFIINGLFNPLLRIKDITDKIGQGDLDVAIHPYLLSAKDEFGELTRAIKEMANKLKSSYSLLEAKVLERTRELEKSKASVEETVKKRTTELEALKSSLEQTVKERTAALESRITELDQRNKYMVDRELKMVDLKKENELLKSKLDSV